MPTEAGARIVIDDLLKQADWTLTNKAQVSTEEPSADGRADYLLRDTRTRPLAVIEAKRFAVDPYTAKRRRILAIVEEMRCLLAEDSPIAAEAPTE